MLGWAVTFLIVALIAAVFGFGGIAAVAVDIAKIIFFVAIVLFVIAAIVGLIRGRTPTVPSRPSTNCSVASLQERSYAISLTWNFRIVADEHRTRGVIRPEVVDALDRQQLGKPAAGAVDAALDGADRAFADFGGLLVGKAGRADQDQRLALIRRQLRERRAEFLEFDPAELIGMRLEAFREACRRCPRPRAAACDIPSGTDCAGS